MTILPSDRLKELIRSYTPSHDQQMIVMGKVGELQELSDTVCACDGLDAVDVAILDAAMPKNSRKEVLWDFSNGNIYVLIVESTLLFKPPKDVILDNLSSPASVVCLDFPEAFTDYLLLLHRHASRSTRWHGLLDAADVQPGTEFERFCRELMYHMEQAGHSFSERLLDLLSS